MCKYTCMYTRMHMYTLCTFPSIPNILTSGCGEGIEGSSSGCKASPAAITSPPIGGLEE
jgi:hypothetical protein